MKLLSKRQLIETSIGFGLIALVLVLGGFHLLDAKVFVRTLIGMGLGYALVRGDFGFAGLSNRTCRKGSTRLIRALMLMFVISAIIVGVLLLNGGIIELKNLWVNPISWGLVVGGILFGIGMAFSSCCATGVLQDFPFGLSRAAITLLFFGAGVYVGFPLMKTAFSEKSLFTSSSNIAGRGGVWFVDWFKWDGTNGILGAILLTVLLAALIGALAKWYEKKISKNYPKVEEEKVEVKEYTTYEKFFVKRWSMTQTALIIALLFGFLYIVSGAGWGASTVYGDWFGRLLHALGVPTAKLISYTGKDALFTGNIFGNAGSMQNIGIILGAIVALLLSNNFTKTFVAGLKIKPMEIILFAVGGFLLGFGTRLSMGCNVGALYTPIADFSLSGWLYFFFIFGGGYVGNMIRKAFYKVVDPNQL